MKLYIKLNSVEDAIHLVNKVSKYDCEADIKSGKYYIDAKSILGVIGVGTNRKILLEIQSEEKEILEELKEFVA